MPNQQLPIWQCHKQVRAAKIMRVEWLDHGPTTRLILTDGLFVDVDMRYTVKHHPQPGGYFVEYEDGYRSYSPGDAFEAGYTRAGDRSIEQYLRNGAQIGTIDYRIRATVDARNTVVFYVHPYGKDGKTMDFRAVGNVLVPQ